jgi:SOS-response transcriptional repressor LexA
MNNGIMKRIGEMLRKRRMALGLRLQDVCYRVEELGGTVDHSGLSRIESGKRWPTEETLNYILKALQCTLEELFMLTSSTNGISQATIGTRKLPLISEKQVTDYLNNNNFESERFVYTERNLSLKAFALNITDDSMSPTFNKGEAVVIDPEIKPEPGDYVVASIGKESYFRQYKLRDLNSFDLSPLNDAFPTISSDSHSDIKIVGTVIEHRVFLKKK